MRALCSFAALLTGLAMAGCGGGGDSVKLAPAEGTVSYQGSPLADATVMFVPEKGPIATGFTDLDGHFTLATGSRRGVAVGPAKVSITAGGPPGSDRPEPPPLPKTEEEAQVYLKKVGEMQMQMNREGANEPKSIIPPKYAKAESSGLQYEVKASGNKFDIKLD
ncbi:MAG TPA: carboxypeptidase-like regulatory domain-containing protein [Planctomycetaceae bacterium]|nr:carboxypeptidase-like regulatory domain-containing protein [Planctomycetaceae bacterium]